MRRFEHRTVVITGASRGIGKGIAKRFADEGANLVLAANEASVEVVAEEFRSSLELMREDHPIINRVGPPITK